MKLRQILLVLSLLAFLSTSTGGYLYYSSLKVSALKTAERQAVARVEMLKRNLSGSLSENSRPVKTLASMSALRQRIALDSIETRAAANGILDLFKATLDVDVCYLLDVTGKTIATSNRNAPDSFLGKNFSFRPYYKEAFHNPPVAYMALGVTSGKRGVYYSYPVFHPGENTPCGFTVIKASIELIEKELGLSFDEIVLIIDPNGIVFISNRQDWLYHAVWKLTDRELHRIAESRQFGTGPWPWIGFEMKSTKYVVDGQGREYRMHTADIDNYPGWSIIHLKSLKAIAESVSAPLIRITAPIVITLCILIGIAVSVLYRKASDEIIKRKSVEKALRKSEERYRSLYLNTPAMLHSIDSNGILVSVSDHWVEMLGYSRDEIIGKNLTDFFTEKSRCYAENVAFPNFFKAGYCKNVTYQFIKKDGGTIDILLSAIAVRDEKGHIVRTLAVSVDVTERNRALKALQQTKEKLSRYSRDLERQVKKQTREITSIIKYTPAVVYIKDKKGCYSLVNSRYEEIFNVRNDDVQGKTDYEILPDVVADQFRVNDLNVLKKKKPIQIEERIPQQDGIHTYFSVKFPIYDESGATSGVCGISTDITAVKKSQEQLRCLSASIIASQEKERSAIARELHDELGQVLTALRMELVWLLERLKNSDPKLAKRALTMCRLIDKNIEDVRGMAIRLRPGVLDDLGLVDALEWYTSDFEKRTKITCFFAHGAIPEIGNPIATAAYRITQEALTNVARHSGANRVDVNLFYQNDLLRLSVKDNGSGFDAAIMTELEGLGLAGMKERASLVGGMFKIRTRQQKGTHIVFKVPVK
ncbi:MAG: hypothetical protein B6I22_03750 [Desulfobacteraceae bacterium 4572_123]|nr:MAG: hypothetical protein B6I22_03750 [Desulfobacteraceae bacterium 4572_123]